MSDHRTTIRRLEGEIFPRQDIHRPQQRTPLVAPDRTPRPRPRSRRSAPPPLDRNSPTSLGNPVGVAPCWHRVWLCPLLAPPSRRRHRHRRRRSRALPLPRPLSPSRFGWHVSENEEMKITYVVGCAGGWVVAPVTVAMVEGALLLRPQVPAAQRLATGTLTLFFQGLLSLRAV